MELRRAVNLIHVSTLLVVTLFCLLSGTLPAVTASSPGRHDSLTWPGTRTVVWTIWQPRTVQLLTVALSCFAAKDS